MWLPTISTTRNCGWVQFQSDKARWIFQCIISLVLLPESFQHRLRRKVSFPNWHNKKLQLIFFFMSAHWEVSCHLNSARPKRSFGVIRLTLEAPLRVVTQFAKNCVGLPVSPEDTWVTACDFDSWTGVGIRSPSLSQACQRQWSSRVHWRSILWQIATQPRHSTASAYAQLAEVVCACHGDMHQVGKLSSCCISWHPNGWAGVWEQAQESSCRCCHVWAECRTQDHHRSCGYCPHAHACIPQQELQLIEE